MHSYIERVLSHISGRQRKAEIENELFDHLDEKEKFWQKIGYDSDSALEKSEEQMGDPDLVGEQLDSVVKRRRVLFPVLAVLNIILLHSGFYIMVEGLEFDGVYFFTVFFDIFDVWLEISSLYASIISAAVVIFGAVNVIIGLKNKRLLNFISGVLCSESMIILSPHLLSALTDSLPDMKKYICRFFTDDYYFEKVALNSVSRTDLIFLSISILVSACVFFFGLRYIIRIRRLTNTKADMKIKNVLCVFCIALITLCVAFNAFLFVEIKAAENSIKSEATAELEEADEKFLECYREFGGKNANKVWKKLCESTDYKFIYHSSSSSEYFETDKAIEFGISIQNPFSFSYKEYDINSLNGLENITSVSAAPVPYSVMLDYNSASITLRLRYGQGQYLEFYYDEVKRDFVLSDSSEIAFEGAETTLTDEQYSLLEAALKEYCSEHQNTRYKNYFLKTLGVYYNEEYDIYKIDFADMMYDIQLSPERASCYATAKVEFTPDKAKVRSYKRLDIYEIKEYFSPEAYKEYKKIDDDIYNYIEEDFEAKQKIKNAGESVEIVREDFTKAKGADAEYYIKNNDLYFKGNGEAVYCDENFYTDKEIKIAQDVSQVQVYNSVVMYLKNNGELYAFGTDGAVDTDYEKSGILGYVEESYGDGDVKYPIMQYYTSVKAEDAHKLLENVTSFSLTDTFAAATDNDGRLFFWGQSRCGQAGEIADEPYYNPSVIEENVAFVKCFNNTLAYILKNGSLYISGDNSQNAVGNGHEGCGFPTLEKEDDKVFTPYLALKKCNSFKFSDGIVTATTTDGSTYKWGKGYSTKPVKQ